MLTVPLAVLGALLGLYLFGKSLNLFSQIGIVMLVGLAAKNGILIVEFANQRRDAGLTVKQAILEEDGVAATEAVAHETPHKASDEPVYSEEEERQMVERLRDLGYE
jgi:hypothetical protein